MSQAASSSQSGNVVFGDEPKPAWMWVAIAAGLVLVAIVWLNNRK